MFGGILPNGHGFPKRLFTSRYDLAPPLVCYNRKNLRTGWVKGKWKNSFWKVLALRFVNDATLLFPRWPLLFRGFLLLVREVFGSTVVALRAVLGTVLVAALGAVSVAAWCHNSRLIICEKWWNILCHHMSPPTNPELWTKARHKNRFHSRGSDANPANST